MSYAPELYDPIYIIGYTGSISEGTSTIYFQMPLPDGQDVRLAIGRITTATDGEQGRTLVLAGNDFQIEETPEGINLLLDGTIVYQDDEPFISIDETARDQLAGIITTPNFQHLLNSHGLLYHVIKANLDNDPDGMPFAVKAARAFILVEKIAEAQEVTGAQDLPQTVGTPVIRGAITIPGLHQLVALGRQNSGGASAIARQSGDIAREYPGIGISGSGVGFSQLSNLLGQMSMVTNSTEARAAQELPQATEVLDTPNPRVPRRRR